MLEQTADLGARDSFLRGLLGRPQAAHPPGGTGLEPCFCLPENRENRFQGLRPKKDLWRLEPLEGAGPLPGSTVTRTSLPKKGRQGSPWGRGEEGQPQHPALGIGMARLYPYWPSH